MLKTLDVPGVAFLVFLLFNDRFKALLGGRLKMIFLHICHVLRLLKQIQDLVAS